MLGCLLVASLLAQKTEMPHDAVALEAGRQLYMGSCSGCHGATGEGSQGPSLQSGRVSRMPDRALFGTIKNGLPGTSMPDFPIANDKVWQIAAFVRSLTLPAAATAPAGDLALGRSVFTQKCAACHMLRGEGAALGPDLSNIGAERTVPQLREALTKPSARIAPGFEAATAVWPTGRTLRGVAKNHNNYSLQLMDAAGKLHLIPRGELKSLDFAPGSLMPPVTDAATVNALIAFLSRQTMRPYEATETVP